MKDKLPKVAFTLIELLVVIAIIGILSGLIIVGMSSSVQSATIAKSQIFSTSLRDSLLANFISEWKLDGNSNDIWGTNNCTWSGSGGGTNTSANWRQASECIYGQCLNFDGTDDYLDCGNGSNLNVNQLTIDFWFKPTNDITPSLGSHTGLFGKLHYSSSSGYMAEFRAAIGALAFYVGDGTTYYSTYTTTNTWKAGKWYYLTFTYDGQSTKVFVNSIRENTRSLGITIPSNQASTFKIGKDDLQASSYLPLSIDNFRIYNAPVPVSQIEDNYYAGLNRLLIGGNISNKEYNLRIKSL